MPVSIRELAKIARLYYLDDVPQREIARRFNVSVATVSRAISKARDLGLVSITIKDSDSRATELERTIEQAFALDECIVVPELAHPWPPHHALAAATCDVLERLVTSGTTLGVSWGRTLKSIGDSIEPRAVRNVRVVPIVGAMGRIETGIYPNSIARAFADRFSAECHLVNTPAVLDVPEVRDSVTADSTFRSVVQVWDELDVVLFSVSSLDSLASVYTTGVFSENELAETSRAGGVGALNFSILGEDGVEIPTELGRRIVNLPLARLDRVRHRVLTAVGTEKTAAVAAALRGRHCTVLITDFPVAERIVEPSRSRDDR